MGKGPAAGSLCRAGLVLSKGRSGPWGCSAGSRSPPASSLQDLELLGTKILLESRTARAVSASVLEPCQVCGFFPLSQLGKCLSRGTSCHAWFYLFTSRSGELDVGLEEPRSWTAEPKEHKALSCCSAPAVPCVLPVRNTRTVEVQLCATMCDVLNYNKRGNTTTAGPGP